MTDHLRKSLNSNDLRKYCNSGIIFQLPYQLKKPTIIINAPNNEISKISTSTSEKKILKTFFKQKTLNISQNKIDIFNKKATSSNYNIRKKSTNQLKIHEELNKFNSLYNTNTNNTNNNYDSVNINLMRNNSKHSTKKFDTVKNGDFYRNNPNLNYNIGKSLNQISMIKIKKPDDFEVSEEDRMFNQYKIKKSRNDVIKKSKTKVKIKLKKKKFNNLKSYDAALGKVYKKIPKILNKIENTKKLKGSMSLLKYQNLLLDVGSKNLNRETRQKLNNKFVSLRKFSDKVYDLFKESLEKIEKKEEKIIESINKQQNYYKRKMREKKYETISMFKSPPFFSLPNLQFHKIMNSKSKKHKKK